MANYREKHCFIVTLVTTIMTYTMTEAGNLTIGEKIVVGLTTLVFVVSAMIPQTVYAQANGVSPEVSISGRSMDLLTKRFAEAEDKLVPLPIASERPRVAYQPGVSEMYVSSTAYSSAVAKTDATPCITADGFNVCANGVENVVAANFLPFGTQIQIPELFGDRIFTVHDRMNNRYYYKVDVWMTSRDRAIQYGIRNVKIRILN
mgnify:CR=1 FL=1